MPVGNVPLDTRPLHEPERVAASGGAMWDLYRDATMEEKTAILSDFVGVDLSVWDVPLGLAPGFQSLKSMIRGCQVGGQGIPGHVWEMRYYYEPGHCRVYTGIGASDKEAQVNALLQLYLGETQ